MASNSGAAVAFQDAQQFLSRDSLEENCSLEKMQSTYKELDSEAIRAECSSSQQAQIDELWRLIKMMYNGATRQEALIVRQLELIECQATADAYGKTLRYLNPASAESLDCSLFDLESAYETLAAAEAQTKFSQAQNQVVDQLLKAINGVKEGDSAKISIEKVWKDRDNAARSRLLQARTSFIGMYPAGAADAFGQALAFLSPDTPDEHCPTVAMEEAFRVLDSELIRLECSETQQNVIDDLWRLIKMTYNGATRQEALAARQPERIQGSSTAQMYGEVLKYLNPNSAECSNSSLDDLESAYSVLSADSLRSNFSAAQNQVIDQLQKVIQGVKGGDAVQVAIGKAWRYRDDAARIRLKA